MNSSLSVLLPVHNGQASLQENVQRLLEVMPELTRSFEIVIVDDGSTDATCEVAYELSRAYPQVNVVRHALAFGWATAVARQIGQTSGEFVMIHCGGSVQADDIAGLWRLRHGIEAAATTPAKPRRSTAGVSRRIDGAMVVAGKENAAAKEVQANEAKSKLGLGVHARAPRSNMLLLHRQQIKQLERTLAAMQPIGWPAATRDARRHGPSVIKRPSFLGKIRNFALGE